MTRHPRAQALVLTAAVSGALVLTGCSTAATPVPSSHASSPTVTPSQSLDTSSGPVVVAPPTTAAQAIADANRSLLGYYKASFTSGHEGGTRLDLVAPWVTGPTLRNERLLAQYLGQKKFHLEGTPTAWSLNSGRSSAAQTKQVDGAGVIDFGSVRLLGCIESTNHAVGAGAPTWTTKGKRASIQWSVLYDGARRQWLVNDSGAVAPGRPLSCG